MQNESFSSRISKLNAAPPRNTPGADDPRSHDEVALIRGLQERTGLYSKIGSCMARAPLFQKGHLTLYCGVPVKYLLPDDCQPVHESLDFVICRGQEALMALKLVETKPEPPSAARLPAMLQKAGFPPGFMQFFRSSAFFESDAEWIFQAVIAPSLDLPENVTPVKIPLRPIPFKLLKALSAPSVRALFAETRNRKKAWYPTEYGRSIGIMQGFRTDKNGGVHALLCCAEQSLGLLQQTVSWGENGPPEPPKEPLSFSQRADLINRGLPSFGITPIMNLVQHFGEMPLEEYFRDDPKGLDLFRQTFPKAGNYQQAAACLENFHYLDFVLLRRLAGPLVRREDIPFAKKPLRSVLLAASFLAKSRYLIWDGEIVFRDNDIMGIAGNWSYRKWLQWAFQYLDKLDKQEDADPNDVQFFNEFICRLAIQPFSMIHHQQVQKAHGSHESN